MLDTIDLSVEKRTMMKDESQEPVRDAIKSKIHSYKQLCKLIFEHIQMKHFKNNYYN